MCNHHNLATMTFLKQKLDHAPLDLKVFSGFHCTWNQIWILTITFTVLCNRDLRLSTFLLLSTLLTDLLPHTFWSLNRSTPFLPPGFALPLCSLRSGSLHLLPRQVLSHSLVPWLPHGKEAPTDFISLWWTLGSHCSNGDLLSTLESVEIFGLFSRFSLILYCQRQLIFINQTDNLIVFSA